MSQPMKVHSSKTKKSSKEREKRKSSASGLDNNCHNNTNEKSSSSSELLSAKYAGLSTENIRAAGEQILPETLSEELCKLLAEDLNYKLRYIVHQASNRAFVSNRSAIQSRDIEETFIDLNLDKVYGSPLLPLWIPFNEQNYLYLDDPKVNIIEEVEAEVAFLQPLEPTIEKNWLPQCEEPNKALINYFKVIAESIISNDFEVRKMALQNLSSNPNIGPIVEWFYRFGYLLLSKDVTSDNLTLYGLDLIETLEMSPIGNTDVSENQLKLLVRLILQRLLKSFTNPDVLKNICWVLAILCRRHPLRELVLTKLIQKLPQLTTEFSLPLITIINTLGIDAILTVYINNIDFFLNSLIDNWPSTYGYTIMETYYLLFKNKIYDIKLYKDFDELKRFTLMLNLPIQIQNADGRAEMNFVDMKKKLIKTRRKIETQNSRKYTAYESVFEIPNYGTKMKQKLENHYNRDYQRTWTKQSNITIGKISLILPALKNKNVALPHCSDHSLFSYNL